MGKMASLKARGKAALKPGRRPWLLRGAVLGLALAVGVVAWRVTGDDEEPAAPPASEARIVDEAEIGNLAALSGHPVYWAGPMPDESLEVTENADGSVQVRYLPEGAEAGEPIEALTVASYPLADPAAALDGFAEEPTSIVKRASDGRKVVFNRDQPTNVYFVSPENSVQVEVFDPSPKHALSLALSGKIQPAS
jgi:hypothetical protein